MNNLKVTSKLLMVFIIGMFLISCVSAWEFDNFLNYKNKDLTVDITNAFGFGDLIGEMTLKSHKSVDEVLSVNSGSEVVTMYYETNFNYLQENGLGKVTFTDMRTGKQVDRKYSYVEVTLPECHQIIYPNKSIGQECNPLSYVKLENKNIPKGKSIIGIVVEVLEDDYIDGIWEVVGKKISKHAVWTEGEYIQTLVLTGSNGISNGVTTNGTDYWVSDTEDDEIYHYKIDGTQVDSFDTAGSGNGDPAGITMNETTIFVGDNADNKVYMYLIDGTASGSFSTNQANGGIRGLGTNGTSIFEANVGADEIYIYDMVGNYQRSLDTATHGSDIPTGVTANDTTIWFNDNTDDNVRSIKMDGTYIGVWSLNSTNVGSYGIELPWGTNKTFFLVFF